ncbi:MAG TPA: glycosyltransferase family 1 protein [Acidobacteriota bacterium]
MQTYLRNLLPELASIPEIQVACFFSMAFEAPALPAGVKRIPVKGPWINNWVWMEWQLPRAVRRMANDEWRMTNEENRKSQVAGRRSKEELKSNEMSSSASEVRTDSGSRHSTFDIRHSTFDLFHFPAYTASSRMSCRKVVSIHDVSYAAYPNWYPHSGGKIRQRFYRRSAECADGIITLSQFSKSEITRVYSIEPSRIFRVHLASGLERVKPAQRWDRPPKGQWYLLHVGDLHARRNLLTALDAFNVVSEERHLDFVLVGRDLGARSDIQQHARKLGCQNRLHFLQDVPLDQMPHWYRNAALLVYPSLYEGFGLPLLEAMQCGCPVVASRAACIPEIAGDAAWLVDPLNAREIAEGIRAILVQPETRAQLIEKGLQRAQQFSWKKTAEQTVGVYREVLKGQDGTIPNRKRGP